MKEREKFFVPISENDIVFFGDTEGERDLNKKLFNTILELNKYQDRYDNGKVKDVDSIKKQINIGSLLSMNATTTADYEKGFIDALKWVTEGCLTEDEKYEGKMLNDNNN